jgi:hypothetical protein
MERAVRTHGRYVVRKRIVAGLIALSASGPIFTGTAGTHVLQADE